MEVEGGETQAVGPFTFPLFFGVPQSQPRSSQEECTRSPRSSGQGECSGQDKQSANRVRVFYSDHCILSQPSHPS